jgi:hypothetical protein
MLREELGWHYHNSGNIPRRHHGLPPGIVGIGFGVKRRDRKIVARSCLRIYVRKKVTDRRDIDSRLWVPSSIRGIQTDIIELPRIVAHATCGNSIGIAAGGVGTLACVVKKPDGTLFVLSNNHVIANLNQANEGDPILMPSPAQDAGALVVATLCAYPRLIMGGVPNPYDAALGEIVAVGAVDPTVAIIGTLNLAEVAPDTVPVTKVGAATQQTTGKVDGTNEDIDVMYNDDPDLTAHFTGQIAIVGDDEAPFSAAGDSGSLVLTLNDRRPMGLLLGGSLTPAPNAANTTPPLPHSFASPITRILSDFKISIVDALD